MAVVLDEVGGMRDAVRQFAQARAQPRLGRGDHALHDFGHDLRAVARNQFGDTAARDVHGRDEGADVETQLVGQARGRHDHLQHVFAHLALIDQLDAGNADALLPDFFAFGHQLAKSMPPTSVSWASTPAQAMISPSA